MTFNDSTDYAPNILQEVIKLRSQYPTLQKARLHVSMLLQPKPMTMVSNYLEGKPRPKKTDVIAQRHSRYSKPALAIEIVYCACTGKCATKRCTCKSSGNACSVNCCCNNNKCSNK